MKQKLKQKTSRELFKQAYRIARQPDSFLADQLTLDIPVHYLLYALSCTGFKLENGSGYKFWSQQLKKGA